MKIILEILVAVIILTTMQIDSAKTEFNLVVASNVTHPLTPTWPGRTNGSMSHTNGGKIEALFEINGCLNSHSNKDKVNLRREKLQIQDYLSLQSISDT